MIETIEVAGAGYRFMPGVSQYSCGVQAMPGFTIERVRFDRVVPMKQGFEKIAEILTTLGRPLTAFCACELRSPAPFSEEGFKAFNGVYIKTLVDWGVMPDGMNPIARSNVCPKLDPPSEPGFYAFSFTTPSTETGSSFVISGSGESVEGKANYRDHTVRLGDTSADGMREKARWVLAEMERRMSAFAGDWSQTTGVQLYTVQNVFSFLEAELGKRGVLRNGLTWHFNRPPVVDLEYEMDCRRIFSEREVTA